MYRPRYTPEPTQCVMSLEPIMRCPNCRKSYHAGYLQAGRLFPECPKCRARWWAMVLHPGLVLPQLVATLEDEAVALFLMREHNLPATLETRHIWQISLTLHEVHRHRDASPLTLLRSLSLLPRESASA